MPNWPPARDTHASNIGCRGRCVESRWVAAGAARRHGTGPASLKCRVMRSPIAWPRISPGIQVIQSGKVRPALIVRGVRAVPVCSTAGQQVASQSARHARPNAPAAVPAGTSRRFVRGQPGCPLANAAFATSAATVCDFSGWPISSNVPAVDARSQFACDLT